MSKYEQLHSMLMHAGTSTAPSVRVMKDTHENSSWHREESVWVHTTMVVHQFLIIWAESGRSFDDHLMFLAGVAALFHDFGKPEAEEEKTNPEGVVYRRYGGHEAISATEFRVISQDPTLWHELFGTVCELDNTDRYVVALMIQHHLPYAYKEAMQDKIIQTVAHYMDGLTLPFFSLLRADAAGRISDDHDVKLEAVETWIDAAESRFRPHVVPENTQQAYLLVGPSGVGKSTYLANTHPWAPVYSMDGLRLATYGDDTIVDKAQRYRCAWSASNEDEKNFKKLCTASLITVVRSDVEVVVSDNMNISKKPRREFIAAARAAGRSIVAVVFMANPPSLEELKQRSITRGDRGIRPERIEEMYRAMYLPAYDEVDFIIIK